MALDGYFTNGLVLTRPDALDLDSWRAIDDSLQRLNRAIRADDSPLVVGTCKEMAESVAKVVLAARGEAAASNEDFSQLIRRAQAALERQPGQGLAADEAVRNTAQAAQKTINYLPELRNRVGTGHGRAYPPDVVDEIVLVAVDQAMMWCRWALRRLGHVIYGRPDSLIKQLSEGTLRRGELAERLRAANLPDLDASQQRAVAIAVGHRALQDTFLVMQEGVEQCAQSSDATVWPQAYREGLVSALLISAAGQIETTPWAVRQIALLLANLPDAYQLLGNLVAIARQAWLSQKLGTPEVRQEVTTAMREEAARMAKDLLRPWEDIEHCIVPPPF